jgi:type I restriction enzyme R subunit
MGNAMTPAPYTEDTLVQHTTAEYLEQQLGWRRSVYAYNNEDFGPDSLLGRNSDREVVLSRVLHEKLLFLNPGLPEHAPPRTLTLGEGELRQVRG